MRAFAVIGANYGDEGKGLITDYLCHTSPQKGVVVRFNGGAQAGHTVVLPNGTRHVFHHFGSGTLAGWPTYLGREFICNPALFVQELNELSNPTEVFVHPMCRVTTPFDMLINQHAEETRGIARHGSCGVGINETVVRHEMLPLTVEDCRDIDIVRDKLKTIRDVWVPQRLCGLRLPPLKNYEGWDFEELFLAHIKTFMKRVHRTSTRSYLAHQDVVVFEGAQGLALDQRAKDFPYVTHSNTGLTNVIPMCQDAEINNIKVHYVTRAYLTRHGAGPLPHEGEMDTTNLIDTTNVHNPWQETLRYAPLGICNMWSRINKDFQQVPKWLEAKLCLAVTCIDQVDGNFENAEWGCSGKEIAGHIAQGHDYIWSNGPTRLLNNHSIELTGEEA
jgi:adenylosuccinate synthase